MTHRQVRLCVFVGALAVSSLLSAVWPNQNIASSRVDISNIAPLGQVATNTAYASVDPALLSTSTAPIMPAYPVTRVVDGDTLVIKQDGKDVKVRLIGINTPETVDPRRPVQCFGKEASDKAKSVLTNTSVRVETDPTQSTHDKYGRLLAYIFLPDGSLFNEYMIAEGYAYEYTYNVPYRYQKEFKAAESAARTNQKGLWAPGVCMH